MYILSNFRANHSTYQRVSVALETVTFWQVFDCDKLTLLKLGLAILCHFGTG